MTHPEAAGHGAGNHPATDSGAHGGPVGRGRRRVHPVTPVLSAGKALAAVVAVIGFNVAQQASGFRDLLEFLTGAGPIVWVIGAAISLLVAALAAALSWVSWRHRFYELADDEVRIGSGWLVRTRRTARLDRVQAVDVNQPLLARLVGLGEVKVETAGGEDSDLTIRFLTMDDCRAVRAAVLEAKREHEGPGEAAAVHGWSDGPDSAPPFPVHLSAPEPVPEPATEFAAGHDRGRETLLHGPVPPGRLFASAALGPGLLLLLAIPILFFGTFAVMTAFGMTGGVSVGEAIALTFGGIVGTSFIGVAVFFAGIVTSVWQRWNRFHGFTLAADDGAGRLQIRAGLTSTRRQTIPVRRIHALQIVEPAWWRPFGWATVHINVAGYAGDDSETSTTLLPVAPLPTADEVADGLIGRITGQPHQPPETGWASPPRSKWVSPIDWRNQTVRVTPRALVVTSGRLRKYRSVIPWTRVQGHTLRQGPISRALSLANVRIDLVGGPVSVTAAQLEPGDAAQLMRILDERRGA